MKLDLTALNVPKDIQPERKFWMSALYQALADLDKPTRWGYTPLGQRKMVVNPYKNDTWRSAMTLIFSGREDDHHVFLGADVDPEALRSQVIRMMKDGLVAKPPGEKSMPYYGVDYRRARINLMRGYQWARTRFTAPMHELYARDCHKQMADLLAL